MEHISIELVSSYVAVGKVNLCRVKGQDSVSCFLFLWFEVVVYCKIKGIATARHHAA
jgi:hypothetical protein